VPEIVVGVANAQDDTSDGAANSICLSVGDPLKLVNTGGVTIANTQEAPYIIMTGVVQYWDGTVMRSGNNLPNQTTWGTVESRRSLIRGLPVMSAIWEIDCDDATTATTRAAYHALINENAEHTTPGVAWNSTYKADPYLDISVHATTHDFEWRIVGISDTKENRFWDGNYVKLLVAANRSQEAGSPTTMHVGV
jgi:hypothetical protein